MCKNPLFILSWIAIILGYFHNVAGQDEMISPNKLVRWNIRLPERLTIGMMVGGNFAMPLITHIPENTYGFKPDIKLKPGWQTGLTGEINVSGKYILFIDIQYLRLTSHTEYNLGNYKDVFHEQLQLISLPSVITYKMGTSGIKYYPMVGFSINCLMGSKVDYNYHPYSTIPTYSYQGNADLLFNRNRLNFSAVLGAGINYQIRKYFVVLEIRYCHDLRNYIDTKEMGIIQIYSKYDLPFPYQSPGFRMHGLYVNLGIRKAHL